jgi:hypothetical protein
MWCKGKQGEKVAQDLFGLMRPNFLERGLSASVWIERYFDKDNIFPPFSG